MSLFQFINLFSNTFINLEPHFLDLDAHMHWNKFIRHKKIHQKISLFKYTLCIDAQHDKNNQEIEVPIE